MSWMNEWDIEEALRRFKNPETPNLYDGAMILDRLAAFTNRNSDGWHSWRVPSNAASRLMELLQSVDRWEPVDVTEADINRVLGPIKSFYTRLGTTTAYRASPAMVEEAVKQKEWIEWYLKESRVSLARRLI
jgi:hypothetical protein